MRSWHTLLLLLPLAACQITCDDDGAPLEPQRPQTRVVRPRVAPEPQPEPEPTPRVEAPSEEVASPEPSPEVEAVLAPDDMPTLSDRDLSPTHLRERVIQLQNPIVSDRLRFQPNQGDLRQ
jgi:hypothetical protein